MKPITSNVRPVPMKPAPLIAAVEAVERLVKQRQERQPKPAA